MLVHSKHHKNNMDKSSLSNCCYPPIFKCNFTSVIQKKQ